MTCCETGVWWKLFDLNVLKPVSEKIRDTKKELKALKEKSSDPWHGFKEQSDIKRTINTLKSDIKIWQNELALKSGQGKEIRRSREGKLPKPGWWE